MHEPVRSHARRGLPVREIALLTVAMVLVGVVSFGFGYVTGRDQVARLDADARRGLDADLADEDLVELLARIEVSDAADMGVGELTYPNELRRRPQERLQSGPRYAIDLGAVPAGRLDDLRVVLRNRGIHADIVTTGDETRMVVGAFADPDEAASWLPGLEVALDELGMPAPEVVPDPRPAMR